MLVFSRYLAVGAGVFFVLGGKLSVRAHKPTLVNSQSSHLVSVEEISPRTPSLLTASRILLASNAIAPESDGAQVNEIMIHGEGDRNDLDAWRYTEPLVSQIKQMDSEDEPIPDEERSPSSLPEQLEPVPETQPQNPELLNPSDNPLRYPTRPNEVDIQTVQAITLEQAIETALKNNREYQITRLELERAREVLQEALAAQYPNLDLSVNLTRQDSATSQLSNAGGTDFSGVTGTPTTTGTVTDGVNDTTATPETLTEGDSPVPDQIEALPQSQEVDGDITDPTLNPLSQFEVDDDTASNFFSGDLTLSYNLYTGGLRPAQIRSAERQVRFNELQVEVIAEDTRLAVANDYYDLQNADAQVNIERAAVEDATQTLRDAQLLEQAGLGTRFDVLQAEVELANANQALTLAIANQRIASRQLAETLSLGPNVGLATADEIEEAGEWDFSLEESIVLAFQNRAELEQFLVQREINRQQREIALAAVRPQLSLSASYDVLENLSDANTGFVDGYSVGAIVQWRLYDGGAARARAEQSETDTDIDEVEFANQRDLVRFQVENAFFSLEANQENIRTAEQSVALAEESLRLARLRFQAGVGTQTEVIDAQTALTEARGNFLTAIIDYNRSFNELQRAVSNLPTNRLFDVR